MPHQPKPPPSLLDGRDAWRVDSPSVLGSLPKTFFQSVVLPDATHVDLVGRTGLTGVGSDEGWEFVAVCAMQGGECVGKITVCSLSAQAWQALVPSLAHYLERMRGWCLGLKRQANPDEVWTSLAQYQRSPLPSSAHAQLRHRKTQHDALLIKYGAEFFQSADYHVHRPEQCAISTQPGVLPSVTRALAPDQSPNDVALQALLLLGAACWMAQGGMALHLDAYATTAPVLDRLRASGYAALPVYPVWGDSSHKRLVLDLRGEPESADAVLRAPIAHIYTAWQQFCRQYTLAQARIRRGIPYKKPPAPIVIPGMEFFPTLPVRDGLRPI